MFPHPNTIIEWFSLYKDTPIIGFIGFDIVYIFSNVLMVFFYLSLFIFAHKTPKYLSLSKLELKLQLEFLSSEILDDDHKER